MKASVKVRAQMGKRVGGKVPYGYIWNGHSLEINEEEAVVRRLIFELFLESKRKKRVASILNERGYRTRGGKIFYDTNVKRWIRDPLSKGLRISHFTEKYDDGKKTRYKPKEEWVFNEAPALVSEEVWQKANDILDEQETTRTKPLNRLAHLFTKFIYCGCGAKMNVRSGNKFYRCTDTNCGNKIVREDLEEIYKSQLTEFIVSPEDIDAYLMGSKNVIEERKQLLQSVQKKKEQLEIDLKKIVDLHLQGHIPTEAFKEYHDAPYQQLQQVKNEIAQLEGELLGMKNQQETKDFIIKEAKSIYGNWDNLGKEEKQTIINAITEKIVIGTDDSIDIVLKQLLPETYSLKNGANGQHNLSEYLGQYYRAQGCGYLFFNFQIVLEKLNLLQQSYLIAFVLCFFHSQAVGVHHYF